MAKKEVVADKPKINVEEILSSMTGEQLQRLKMLAVARGISAGAASRKTADGLSVFEIKLAPELVEQLEIWAESDNVTLVEEVQMRVVESLTAYLYGDWRASEAVVPTAVPPPAAAAASPAAATVPPPAATT